MAYHNEAPYKAQDVHEVSEMLRGLEASQGKSNKDKGKTGFSAKKNTYTVQGSKTTVDSWRMQDWDYKKPNLPTYARGLFTAVNSKQQPEIDSHCLETTFSAPSHKCLPRHDPGVSSNC
jgi:tRNA ligase